MSDPADGAETTRVLFAYAQAAAQACDLSAELGRRAQNCFRRPRSCAPRGQGRRCGRCSTRTRSAPRRQSAGSPSAARGGSTTGWSRSARSANSPDGRPSASMGSERWRGQEFSGDSTRSSRTCRRGALARMDGPGRGGDLRLGRADLAENLARVVGKACNLDLIIDDIRGELRDRPYEIVNVAGGGAFGPNWGLARRSGPRSGLRKRPNCRARMRSC